MLEEHGRCEMKDSTARLTQRSEEIVNLEIQVDMLEIYLSEVQEQKDDNK